LWRPARWAQANVIASNTTIAATVQGNERRKPEPSNPDTAASAE
jgi:hypothetical protein